MTCEAAGLVQAEAGGVLGEHAGLQCPGPLAFGSSNELVEQQPTDALALEARAGVDAVLGDADVRTSVRHRPGRCPGTLNHLGVEVEVVGEVEAAEGRLSAEGVATTGIHDTTCCYALKTETWVNDPDGAPWEWYVKTGDAEHMTRTDDEAGQCCAPGAISESVSIGAAPGSAGGCC